MDQEKCEVLFVNTDINFPWMYYSQQSVWTDYSFVVILQLLPWAIQQM